MQCVLVPASVPASESVPASLHCEPFAPVNSLSVKVVQCHVCTYRSVSLERGKCLFYVIFLR